MNPPIIIWAIFPFVWQDLSTYLLFLYTSYDLFHHPISARIYPRHHSGGLLWEIVREIIYYFTFVSSTFPAVPSLVFFPSPSYSTLTRVLFSRAKDVTIIPNESWGVVIDATAWELDWISWGSPSKNVLFFSAFLFKGLSVVIKILSPIRNKSNNKEYKVLVVRYAGHVICSNWYCE